MFRGDKFITPLMKVGAKDIPDQGATGVWLSIGDLRFLVTAAHAVDDGYIWFPMQEGLKRLNSPGVATTMPPKGREHDRGDLAIFQLSAEDKAAKHPFHEYVDISKIEVNLDYRFKDLYEFTGYPFRRGKLNRTTKMFEPGYMSVTSETVPEQKYESLGLSIHSHVVVVYQREKMIRDGKTMTAPLPHGVSGGAVWKRYPGSEERKLAAIAIEYRAHTLIGTRISAALELIRARHPSVSELIPRPKDTLFEITHNGRPVVATATDI